MNTQIVLVKQTDSYAELVSESRISVSETKTTEIELKTPENGTKDINNWKIKLQAVANHILINISITLIVIGCFIFWNVWYIQIHKQAQMSVIQFQDNTTTTDNLCSYSNYENAIQVVIKLTYFEIAVEGYAFIIFFFFISMRECKLYDLPALIFGIWGITAFGAFAISDKVILLLKIYNCAQLPTYIQNILLFDGIYNIIKIFPYVLGGFCFLIICFVECIRMFNRGRKLCPNSVFVE